MELDRFDAPARLAELLTIWRTMGTVERTGEPGRVLAAEVRGMGQAAAYLGGWEGMQKLDKAVGKAGGPNHLLNELWDGIGAWVA